MRMLLEVVAVVAGVLLSMARTTLSDETRVERDAKGGLHITIEGPHDSQPPEPDSAPGSGEAIHKEAEEAQLAQASVRFSRQRTELENQLNAAAAELAATRDAISETGQKAFTGVAGLGPFATRADAGVLAAQTAQAVTDFEEQKRRMLDELRARERSDLKRIAALNEELNGLREAVRSVFAKPPTWWRDKIDCKLCPSPSEVADALR